MFKQIEMCQFSHKKKHNNRNNNNYSITQIDTM